MPTPLRNIRISDDLWDQLKARARDEDTDVSTLIRHLITNYLTN